MTRGYCVHTISGTTKNIEGDEWWNARPTMLMLPYKSWAKLKSYIIESCKVTGQCDQAITSWERTINTVDKAVENK